MQNVQLKTIFTGNFTCPGANIAKTVGFLLFANLFRQFDFRGATGEQLPSTDAWQVGVSARPLPFKVQADRRE